METTNSSPTPPSNNNNGKTVGIVIAIILIALAVWYFMSGRSKQSTMSDTETNLEQTASGDQKSLKELMALNKSQKCSYSDSTNQGTIYFADGKMRGDFTTNLDTGQTVTSHMMVDGEYMYNWSDATEGGMKIKIDANQTTQSQSQQNAVDVNKPGNYNCGSWSADNSMFMMPTNIKFQDFSNMMPQGSTGASGSGSGSVDMKAQQCAACDSLTGDDKTQCRTALSCN